MVFKKKRSRLLGMTVIREEKRYLREPTAVLREQISVLDEDEYFIFLPVAKLLRVDDTAFKASPINTAHFSSIYRSICQKEFSCKDDKVF